MLEKRARLHLFPPIALAALAAALRFWRLDAIPPGFHYDEAYEALEAWRVLTRPGYHPIFFPGNFGVEPSFIYLTAAAFRLFGATPAVMRGVAACLGTLSVLALYGLCRELALSSPRVAPATPFLAGLALAIMRWHIHYSRVGIEPILVPLLLILCLWALWRGLRTNSWPAWTGLGLTVGLGPYTYPAGRLLFLAPVLTVAMLGLADRRRLSSRWKGLWAAGLIALLTFAPLAIHWARHPDQLLLRSSQVAVVGDSAARGGIGRNLLATLAMFSIRGDLDPRNNVPGLPALDPLMSIPFYLGLILALARGWRPPKPDPLLGSLPLVAAAFLLPTMLSEYAPHFRRGLGVTPLVALFCGLGLATILGRHKGASDASSASVPRHPAWGGALMAALRGNLDRLRPLGRLLVVVIILTGSGVFSGVAYFGHWASSPALYYAYDQGLWEIGQYVLQLPADEPVYLSPRPATDMTLAFAWREGRPVRHFDGRHAFIAPAYRTAEKRDATYIVIEHEDFRGWRLLNELYPQASVVVRFLDRDGNLYAQAWHVPDCRELARGPRQPFLASFPGVDLIGYDLSQEAYRPGQIVYLQLWWRATGRPARDWTVFTHLLGPPKEDGSVLWAGHDARPGQGSAAMSEWVAGDLILDEHQLPLQADAPAGEYQIEVGLYDLAAGGERAVTTSPAGQDHLILGVVRVQ